MMKREREINYMVNEGDPLRPTIKASHPEKSQLIAMNSRK